VEERGLVAQAKVLLIGYLGSEANAAVIADFVTRARRQNPDMIYLCDPVMGDDGKLYVAEGIVRAMRDLLVPAANVVTPNQFELEALTGISTKDAAGVRAASAALRSEAAAVIVTGCVLGDTRAGQVETIISDGDGLVRIASQRLPIRPCGTGDLLSGMIAAELARGSAIEPAVRHAVDGVFAVLLRTQQQGSEEMSLVPLPARAGADHLRQ
jgi:pyridoxine kinase